MSTTLRRLLPGLLALASAVILLMTVVPPPGLGRFEPAAGPLPQLLTFVLTLMMGTSYAFVGGLILRRHPRHVVGWLLAWFALSFSVGVVLDNYARASGWIATFSGVGWMLGLLPLVALTPLVFPTGAPPSRSWRWAGRLTIVGVLVVFAVNLVDPALNEQVELANPLGVEAMAGWIDPLAVTGMIFVMGGALGGLASLVGRYRRATDIERQQIRWFAYGATVTLLSAIVLGVLYEIGRVEVGLVVFGIGSLALPSSIGFAILRYRLYDIDRIVSRTLSYGLVTLVLAGIYILGVVGVGGVVRAATGGGGGDLVVAASTLAVAALFRPLRRRIQQLVDRRFNRTRYDAARTVEDFAQRLRDEVDLSTLVADLGSTVRETVGPDHVSVWIATAKEPS